MELARRMAGFFCVLGMGSEPQLVWHDGITASQSEPEFEGMRRECRHGSWN